MLRAAVQRCKPNLVRKFSTGGPRVAGRARAAESPSARVSAASASEANAAVAEGEVLSENRSSTSWRAFKALFGLSALAIAGGTSYVTYAHSSQEVEDFMRPYRQEILSAHKVAQDADLLERVKTVLYRTSVKAAVDAVDLYLDARKNLEDQVKGFTAPSSDKLLPDLHPSEQGVYTLVLDLNETLVYSDWKRERGWGTFKRPGVDAFLEKMAHFYEIVLYSDQLGFYIDPIVERLDPTSQHIRYRLDRNATNYINGKHYRDLSKLNRDPKKVLYISGHALESCLQPENALPVKPWKLEENDTALLDLLPFLEFLARNGPPDVRAVLASYQGRDIATEFRERALQNQRRVQERRQPFWRSF